MSAAYVKGVSDNLDNAQVVYDKFHVIKYVMDAGDSGRKLESRADAGKLDRLELTRWMWLKNWVKLTEKEAENWESMPPERCVTDTASEMGLLLQGIYEWKDVGVARKLFGNGCAWVQKMREQIDDLLEPMMVRAARMIEGRLEEILAYWNRGLTTALMEGLNSQFSAAKRKARGYRMVKYMAAMLCFVAGKLTLPYY